MGGISGKNTTYKEEGVFTATRQRCLEAMEVVVLQHHEHHHHQQRELLNEHRDVLRIRHLMTMILTIWAGVRKIKSDIAHGLAGISTLMHSAGQSRRIMRKACSTIWMNL